MDFYSIYSICSISKLYGRGEDERRPERCFRFIKLKTPPCILWTSLVVHFAATCIAICPLHCGAPSADTHVRGLEVSWLCQAVATPTGSKQQSVPHLLSMNCPWSGGAMVSARTRIMVVEHTWTCDGACHASFYFNQSTFWYLMCFELTSLLIDSFHF